MAGFRAFLSGIVTRIKAIFGKRTGSSSEAALRQAEQCGAEEHNDPWAVKDVMVGTVRTEEQLHFNLLQCSYYVPARFVPDECLPVRYIALHEEDLIDEPGIKRCGKVLSVQKIRRGSIPVTMRPKANPDEIYYYFTVREWNVLPQPIRIRDTFRGKPQFTNRFLLDHCRDSYQLFAISSEEEYRLMTEIDRMLGDPETAVYRVNSGRVITATDGFLTVANENGEILDRIAADDFVKHPRAGFIRIKKALLGKENGYGEH